MKKQEDNQIISIQDIQKLFKILFKNWYLFVGLPLIAFFISYVYSHRLTDVYAAKTQILVKSEDVYDYQQQIYKSLGYYDQYNDIQNQINDLKTRVIEYESRINNVALDPNLLRMIKLPLINHEIELINGTIVQGSILQEDIDRIILKTQIGQIRIEKADIVSVKEIAPNSPILSFEVEPEQKIFDDKRVFSGTILNEGVRRADFARVVFYLWDENTNLISSDSAFINGSTIQYSSGIITDCALEPSESANYNVGVAISDTANVKYITKEIHFSIYE